MIIKATTVDIVGTLQNNGSAVGGGGAPITFLEGVDLNVNTTTNIAEIALADGGRVSISLDYALWDNDGGTTNFNCSFGSVNIMAISNGAGTMFVGDASGTDGAAGADGNSWMEFAFVPDEINNKAIIQATHHQGAYAPTVCKISIEMRSLTNDTVTVL